MGVLAVAGIPYSYIEDRFGISSSYYYSLRERAEKLIELLFRDGEWPIAVILVTKDFIERCVMALSMYCRSPIEGIVSFFDLVIGKHISKGSIGRIRKQASKRAQIFDEQVGLGLIREIAVDEIFQQNEPILTAIDLESGYAAMIHPAEDRSGETWQSALEQYRDRGLNPELSVSDGGSGLLRGLKMTYPEIVMQPDVFHMLRELGREVQKVDKMAVSELSEYYRLHDRIFVSNKKKPSEKDWSRYFELKRGIDSVLLQSDSLRILYDWLREYVSFTGYGYAKSLHICEWIMDEMAMLFPKREKLQKAIRKFRSKLPELLAFLRRLQEKMDKEAGAFEVSGHDFMLLYQQQTYPYTSKEYLFAEERLFKRFGKRLPNAREVLKTIVTSVRRSSSWIENLNGRIRCFIDLKREIPEEFFILIKVFFNTKKQFRSRRKGWKNTSAIERMTGQQYPEFLDIVSSPMNYLFSL